MMATLKNGYGEFEVRIVDRDSTGIKVELKEDTPFGEKGSRSWVAPRFVEKW